MRFFSPAWLWCLTAIPFLYFAVLLDEKRRQKQFSYFADKRVWSLIVPEMIPNHRIKKARYFLAAACFAILALARPQFGTHEETVTVSGLDIMVALDVSNSMEVEDVVPSRLLKAKHVIRSIVNQLGGDRVGIVAFAGSSYVACPLTTDLNYLLDTVQILGPRMIQNQGTDIGIGLQTAANALERGGEEPASTSTSMLPSHVVILISDGEDHEAAAIHAAEKFKEKGTKLYILGVGTESGGPIPLKDESGNSRGFKKDRSGEPIVSTFRSTFLQQVAKAGDGKYWNITAGEAEVQELLGDLGALNRADYSERRYLVYEDRFQIPLIMAVILLLLEISVPARKILVSLFIFVGPMAYAGSPFKNPPSLDAYLENKRGIEAYKKGNIEEAQKEFGSAQARDPSRPELEYNQGTVEMQKGNVDRAIESFKNSARAADDNSNPALLGKSLYNLGNALAKKGDLSEAVRSYLGAIQSARTSKDSALEYEARKNLQLLIDENKKQKQKQQEQDKKEGKEGQDKKDQQKSEEGEGKDQEQKKKGQEEPSRYQETSKEKRNQPFQSQKLTPEDANRVMSELTTKERELQEKLQAQHAKSQDNPKDW